MSLAYHNGQFIEKNQIAISPSDFGFARGVALYELARIYGGVPFRINDHLERLDYGVRTLGISCPISRAELLSVIGKIVAKNNYTHSTIKIYLTAGECAHPSATSYGASHGFTPHLMIMEEELNYQNPEAPYGLDLYQRGQRLKCVPYERELPYVKSTNYMLGYYAVRQVAGKDWDDILFMHRDGFVTEATRSNFFCVIDGVLCTPKENMLYGITRKVVLELAAKLSIPIAERNLKPADIIKASEAFTTNSTNELLPTRQIDNYVLPTTMEGKVFSALRKAFSAYLAECTKPLAKVS